MTTELVSALLSQPSKDPHAFLYEEFGLSLYNEGELFPSMTLKEGGSFNENDITTSFFLNGTEEGSWCPPTSFNNFDLFSDTFQTDFPSDTPSFLSDTPPSSFPSTPHSHVSDLHDKQEINDILSSFQIPLYTPQEINGSFVSPIPSPLPSSLPSPSPPLPSSLPSPSPPLPPSLPSPPPTLGKRSHTDETPPTTPPTIKRPPKSTSSRKERKKEQNKTAAFRYRQKKRNELDVLLKQEEELESKNKKLKSQVDSLTNEISYLKNLWSEVCKAKSGSL